MKIVIDARMYGTENTGIGRYIINLIRELSSIDINNTYYVILKKKYFNTLKLPNNWKKILLNVPHYTVREQILLPIILYRIKPDVVHFPQVNVPLLYWGKRIVTVHDLTQLNKDLKATTLPYVLYMIKFYALKSTFAKASRSKKIIVPTNHIKKELVEYGASKEKISVIYEGFDPKIEETGNYKAVLNKYKLKKPYFIYAGNAYPHKNIKKAIDATELLNHQNNKNNVTFAICSARNSFTNDLTSYLKKNNINCVKLLGYVNDSELATLLKHSTGFVFPSLAEGFGLPGLEALAIGTPVLASNIPVFKEIYKDTALYFDPHKEDSIADAMNYLLELDSVKRELLIKKGKEVANEYSWNEMARQTLDVYNQSNEKD